MENERQSIEQATNTTIGKRVGSDIYVHISALTSLPPNQQSIVREASELAKLAPTEHFNAIRISQQGEDLSFLDYPDFLELPFPILARSWRISLSRKTVVFRNYAGSRNPPILHRKELLLPASDPRIPEFSLITQTAESLGLFDEPNKIGFREHWSRLIADRGYELVGNEFLPIANSVASLEDSDAETANGVKRHLTALSRYNFSAPVQALSRHGLITPSITFFDYGCGRGDDVRGLIANGIDATGWDPHFASEAEKRTADLVNIGFVVNVIEDIDERVEALRGAYTHTRGVLAVAAMLTSNSPPEGRQFRDGYMTSRNTFQKYYTQAQLRDFIEHTLDEVAIAAAPGVFFVFRDKDLEQQFLSRRYGHRAPTILSRGSIHDRPAREKAPRIDRERRLFDEHRPLLGGLWLKMLELGRIPDKQEIHNLTDIEAAIGSVGKALRIVQSRFDASEFALARASRTEDIVVLLAMQQFEKRKPYKHLEISLQRDIRTFFGDYTSARDLAKESLFELGKVEAIDRACREAAEKGLGHLEDSQSLQLHVSLVERLPKALRIYIGCATVLCGDISEFDLVKIHIRSGKVTLLKFEEFESRPLPRLAQRVKVMLREQDMDIFNYGKEFPPTLLYGKSRFINEEFSNYAEQLMFEEKLDSLGLFDFSGYGPSESEFQHKLARARWEIDGFSLLRARRTPELDEPCGTHFTYRQLIECGETQANSKIPNLPKEPDTYTALYDLATKIIDPIIEYFGMIRITYCFCSSNLAKLIPGRIAIELDQHASHEKNSRGNLICKRRGAAVDFLVEHEDMLEVANWLTTNLPFDRLYYYGKSNPIHVSLGPEMKGEYIEMVVTPTGRRVPRKKTIPSSAPAD